MKRLFLLALLLGSLFSFSQNEANIWYFGNKAGLDFNPGDPVVLEDGAIDNFEGVSVISDYQGNLLFYTNGMTIWNRNHQVMQNGTGLLGHNSSTQSGVIIPLPGSATTYYVFTVDYAYNSGAIYYSIVDMKLQSGLGEVTTKNTFVQSNAAEKISAVMHDNGSDIWVVIHERHNSVYKSYLLTQCGLSDVVVSSSTGPYLETNGEQGCLKLAPDGHTLAMATYHNRRVDICDFNNQTGEVNCTRSLDFEDATYGVEFSKNSEYLYVSVSYDVSALYQVDLQTGLRTHIATPGKLPGSLQLGPDGKIYVARYMRPNIQEKYLGVINNPEQPGSACNYIDQAIHLGTGFSKMGLPTFIQSYFHYTVSITGEDVCNGQPSHFNAQMNANFIGNLEWMEWDFGDPLSMSNTSSMINPTHVFSAPGTYNVSFTAISGGNQFDRNMTVTVSPGPEVALPDTSYLCSPQTKVLDAGPNGVSYLWSDNSTERMITVNSTGDYWVQVTDALGCISRDTSSVFIGQMPVVSLPDSIKMCPGDSTWLDSGAGDFTYLWSNQSTGAQLLVKDEGDYQVWKTNTSNCTSTATTHVDHYILPMLDLGPDTMMCNPDGILLIAGGFDYYKWQDNSGGFTFLATEPGTYNVEGTTGDNCKASDEINVQPCCYFSINVPNAFTPNDDGINDTFKPVMTGITECKMTVANRWGAILFTTTDMYEGWNGKFENSDCPEGVYVVLLEYRRCDIPVINFIDHKIVAVTLLR